MTIKATTKALLGTAVSFALLGTAGMANAADLDNLSDDDLLKRIERLEKIIGPGEKSNAVRNGNNKVRLSLSGQVNRLAVGFGDGEDFEVRNLDNTTSSTRFRLIGAATLDENWSAGTNIEIEVTNNNSLSTLQDQVANPNPEGDLATDVRRAALFVKHKTLGQLLIGQFQTASDFSFHNDLSGTFISGYSEVHLIGGGTVFRLDDGDNNLTTINISDATTGAGFDGGSRDDVIRYDTASFGGFKGKASYTSGDEWAVDLGYRSKDLAGFTVAANIAYTNFGGSASGRDLVSGSASAVHNATGLNATFSYGDDNQDNTAYYGKLGWKKKLTSLGSSNFVFEAGFFENQNGTESILVDGATGLADTDDVTNVAESITDFETESTVLGVAYVQQIDALALEAFVAYRNFSLDDIDGQGFDDINTIAVGGRIKF
ncbi:MAG: hypothetical protein ABJN78_04660 [Hyphomicrobiales bacterium]